MLLKSANDIHEQAMPGRPPLGARAKLVKNSQPGRRSGYFFRAVTIALSNAFDTSIYIYITCSLLKRALVFYDHIILLKLGLLTVCFF